MILIIEISANTALQCFDLPNFVLKEVNRRKRGINHKKSTAEADLKLFYLGGQVRIAQFPRKIAKPCKSLKVEGYATIVTRNHSCKSETPQFTCLPNMRISVLISSGNKLTISVNPYTRDSFRIQILFPLILISSIDELLQ